ncbi:GNAT family N-acetyltransferase [Neolewinella agarilytica]|uniref:GNAT family N-acetyltransferase n=1 Tax=Neolewinella agarilytica TaxID=478744 RepID=UPI00158723AB|nr:GNAT family N-acetyltransferase [Neolewinella agarilytica]
MRKLAVEDLPALVRYANDPAVGGNIVNIPYPYREPDAAFRIGAVLKAFNAKTGFIFAMIHKDRQELIGEISLHLLDKVNPHAQLAYWTGEPFRNQGLTTEAVASVLEFGFDTLNVDLIYGDCKEENIASARVMMANGMKEHSRRGSLVVYAIEKERHPV